MSLEEFDLICDKLSGLTEYIYLHVMGEPLTHPDLVRFISLASEKGFKCAITTNGTLLKKRSEELLSSPVYKINLSVHSFEDGTEEEYYSYLSDLTEFASRSSENGILTVLRLWNEGCDGGRNERTLAFLKNALPGEWKEGVRGARIRHKLHLEYGERFEWPDMKAQQNGGNIFCYGLADHFGILSDGTVIPCCLDREGEIALGNAFRDDLSSVLSSERAESIREGFKKRCAKETLCQRCGYATRFK
jgi:radical SAM protein with 4Fe4S-binding SPASM domain